MIKKLILVVFAALLHFSVFAQEQYEYTDASCGTPGKTLAQWGTEVMASVLEEPAYAGSTWLVQPEFNVNVGLLRCYGVIALKWNNYPNGNQERTAVAVCPDSTWQINTTNKNCQRVYVPPVCDPGPAGNRTWFAGWNTVSGGDLDTEVPGSDPQGRYIFCEGGCELVSDDVIDCWTQTEAADNGYFRQTCELSYSKTGTPCTESDSPPGPTDAPPLPPGTPDPNPGGDDPTGPDSDNDSDGGDGGPTGGEPTKDPDACSASQIANGTCPGSGSGPVGGGGSSPPVPDDPATCGGEGQPLCRVQVNESGTTDGSGHLETMKGHGDKLTELSKEDGTFWTKVKTYLHKTANELAGWTWSFSLPTGCTPMHLDGFDMTIDVCQFQGTIHDLMSFLWVLCTVYGLVRLFIWGIA